MASKAVLNELFEVSKASPQFKGMSENDIREACEAYSDRPDEDIRTAMENIQNKDRAAVDEAEKQRQKIRDNKEKMNALHKQELIDRKKDEQDADEILEYLFKS